MAEMILKATGSKLQIISAIHVTSTQAQYDTCLFEFDEAWDGYGVRTAVFYSNPNNIKAMLLDGDNKCYIPWDSFGNSRYLYIGVYGNNGESYLPTQFVEVMYQPGANVDDHLYPPTPGIYEQFVIGLTNKADISALNEALTLIEGKADASLVESLDALISDLVLKTKGFVSILKYGADASGTEDVSQALITAISDIDAAGGGTVFIPPGVFKLSQKVSVSLQHDIAIVGAPGSTIDASNIASGVAITLQGTLSNAVQLAADALKGSHQIAGNAMLGLQTDDILLVTTNGAATPELWDPSRPYYYKGELCRVESISGNVINLSAPLYDNYTQDVTYLHRIAAKRIIVHGVKIRGNSDFAHALHIKYARDISVRDCEFSGLRSSGMHIYWTIGGIINNCHIYDITGTLAGTDYYGIALATVQDIVVSDNRIEGGNHCITTGGQEPCRNLLLRSNTLTQPTVSHIYPSIGMHENAEFVTIERNKCSGGISAMGRNLTIVGNDVIENRGIAGILISPCKSDGFFIANNNNIECTAMDSIGLRFTPMYSNLIVDRFECRDNRVTAKSFAVFIQPRQSPTANNVHIRSIDIIGLHAITEGRGLVSTLCSVEYFRISGCLLFTNTRILEIGCVCTKLLLLSDTVAKHDTTTDTGIGLYNNTAEQTADIIVHSNRVESASTGDALYIQTTGDALVQSNILSLASKSKFMCYGARILLVKDNILSGTGDPAIHVAGTIIS